MNDQVLVDDAGGVRVITINRPQARNAVNAAVARAVADAMDGLDADPEIAVGVLTGAGGTFCSGADLKALLTGELPVVDGRGFGGLADAPPRKPLIAAVEGWALAGGCELVLTADVVVAARTAVFGLPEVRRGLVAAGGGLLRLPRAVPHAVAMCMALTGEPITAADAERHGLVSQLTEEGGALTAALETARHIAANGPCAVRVTKAILARSTRWADPEEIAWMRHMADPVFSSEEAKEGASAFAEKRAPSWRRR
ncbi:crotonase/enoyl-CoA hydratase family protein [Streptomyces sp. NRRL F-5126]|uniref:crotonase/enoyl-CoA hydratase family protein n=1 Tax=Streptomyces sp. NRRL F-5126 TaxID=1463857 RepID=UPI0004C98389|nr:crotonase/enoyl-CoA hydratase family protein [Streptomyces sp. NRRL F-5126]